MFEAAKLNKRLIKIKQTFNYFLGLPPSGDENICKPYRKHITQKGRRFRNSIRDWFKNETDFGVVDYEVTIKKCGD